MRKHFGLSLLSITLLLAGCGPSLEKPSQSSDSMIAGHATYQSVGDINKQRIKVVKEYVPVAVPGQLMPVPKQTAATLNSKQFKTKEAAVAYANKNATVFPESHDFFNSMMTYGYVPGQLYTIYAAPMHITDIALQPGEKIISEAAGDTLRWQIAQTYSGEGITRQQHLLVKPNKPDLTNTVVITTNRRTYHLVLHSTNNDTYMASVQWNYPGDMVNHVTPMSVDDTAVPTANSNNSLPFEINLADLDFNYKFGMIQGNKPAWYPVRVFNDGRQTFIEFPKSASNADMPILYIANNNDKYGTTTINYRTKRNYMIIDTVIKKARLQTGVKNTGRTIVQIAHD